MSAVQKAGVLASSPKGVSSFFVATHVHYFDHQKRMIAPSLRMEFVSGQSEG
jgi:hypothetical protein